MREIKFRYTWQRKNDKKIWVEIVPIECLEKRGDTPFIHQYTGLWELIARDQWTGLQDKNDKDVFEGDVYGFDEGIKNGLQTESYKVVIRFGEWECGCDDYYCNESGIGFYINGERVYYRATGEIDVCPIVEESIDKLPFGKCEYLGTIHEKLK